MPDRLELVKGPPALRRSHVDHVIAASWPARSATRRAYGRAMAQRNALLAGIRSGRASRDSLPAWDAELARHGIALRDDRAAVVDLLAPRFTALAEALGLGPGAELRYRPRSRAVDADELAAELAERIDSDLERGFTGHGPHRDDIALLRDGRELRAYGSQGEQRLALLSLLLAERSALADTRSTMPLMLLDDVMSELDADRRAMLADLLRGAGQSVITTTELAHVPGAEAPGTARLAVGGGRRPRRCGGRSVTRRRAPRPVGVAIEELTQRLAPATLLADVQRVWEQAAGAAMAAEAQPDLRARRDRHAAVLVGRLDARDRPHGPLLVDALNGALGADRVCAVPLCRDGRTPALRLTSPSLRRAPLCRPLFPSISRCFVTTGSPGL